MTLISGDPDIYMKIKILYYELFRVNIKSETMKSIQNIMYEIQPGPYSKFGPC